MKTKTNLLKVLLAVIIAFSTLAHPLDVFATQNSSTIQDYLNNNAPDGSARTSWTNSAASSFFSETPPSGNVSYQAYTVGSKTYYIEDTKITTAESKINSLAQNKQATEGLSNITTGMGIGADTASAMGTLSGLVPILNYVLGIIVVLLSLGMTIFSAFDICYIAWPVFRNACEESKNNGGIMASNKKGADGGTKLRFITDEAIYAVNSTETSQTGKNPILVYLGKRVITYMLLAVMLFILVTGNITIFTDIAIRLTSGLLDLISSL